MKRVISSIFVIIIAISSLGGCVNRELFSRVKKQDRTIKVGISVYDQYDTFIASIIESFREWVRLKEQETNITITIDLQNAGGNQNTQNDQMETFVTGGCNVVLINLVDRTDATVIIDKARNAGIPAIFFNRELVKEDLERWDQLYYVGAEALESGEMEGQILLSACQQRFDEFDKNHDGRLQYVLLEGEAGHQDALIRTQYVVNTVTQGGITLEKLDNEIANWSRAQGASKMKGWMEEFDSDMEVVFANNDDMALGAIDGLKEWGREKWPVVLGIDGTKEALTAVKNQELLGTVKNDAKGQARSMLELAWSLRFQTKLPKDITLRNDKSIRLPYQIVTIDNVDQMIRDK